MKISIITPSLNQSKFIKDCIKSVKNQIHSDFEHIIVDGLSTDDTISILENDDSLIWVAESDHGQSDAVNKGIRLSSGDIIGWINADDYYEKNIFKAVANIFDKNKSLDIIYGDVIYVNKNKNRIGKYPMKKYSLHKLLNELPTLALVQGAFFRKKVFEKIGYLNEDLHYAMDLEFFVRAGYNNLNIKYIPQIFAYYRKHEKAKTNSANPENKRAQFNEVLSISKKFGGSMFSQLRYFIYKYKIKQYLIKIVNNMFS